MCQNEQKLVAGAMKKESSGTGAMLMKTKRSEAGAKCMKRRAPVLCHFYDGSAVLLPTTKVYL